MNTRIPAVVVPPAAPTKSSEVSLYIPPKSLKRLDDPFKSERYAYEALLPVTEAAKLIIGNANPRYQNLKSSISKSIRASLRSSPSLFHLKNRGIWVAAESAEYDNQSGKLLLNCPQTDKKRYGTIDGGHTLKNIQEHLAELAITGTPMEGQVPHVFVHIRIGIEEQELNELVETLNRSVQLKEYSLANFRGEFEPLKKLIDELPWGSEVDWQENGEGAFDVVDVLQRLALFSNQLFPGKLGKHPVEAYSSKSNVLSLYLDNPMAFLELAPIMNDCFRLPDQIERMLPEVANTARFGNFQFAKSEKKPFIADSLTGASMVNGIKSWESRYTVSTAVTYPLAAALRVLVSRKKDGTVVGWKSNPVEFFFENGKDMFQPIANAEDKNPTVLGKDKSLWQTIYHAAYACLHPED